VTEFKRLLKDLTKRQPRFIWQECA